MYICERHYKPEDKEICKFQSFHIYTFITIFTFQSFEANTPEIVDVGVLKARGLRSR